jgi:hypothetical protein
MKLGVAALAVGLLGSANGVFGQALSIGDSVNLFHIPRDEKQEPVGREAYLIPRFTVLIDHAPVTDSSPDSVFARLFSFATGTQTRALIITAQFNNLPEMPLLVVERTANSFKQHSVIGRSVAPALLYPANGRRLLLRMRHSVAYNAPAITKYLGLASTLSAGMLNAPIGLLPAGLAVDTKDIEHTISSIFSTQQEYLFDVELSDTLVKANRRLDFVFYDRTKTKAGASAMATVEIDLETRPSLFMDPDANGKYADVSASKVLSRELGITTLNKKLSEIPQFAATRLTNTTAAQYTEACAAVRQPLYSFGMTDVDVSLAYYSVVATSEVIQPNGCPRPDEQARMTTVYGLPPLTAKLPAGAVVDEWAQYYKAPMETLAKAATGQGQYGDILGRTIIVRQYGAKLLDLPLDEEHRLSPGAFEQKMAKAEVSEIGEFEYLRNGEVTALTVVAKNGRYRLDATFASEGLPGQQAIRLQQIVVRPAELRVTRN